MTTMQGGEDTDGQHDIFGRPGWVSHLPAGADRGLQGKKIKLLFPIPGDTICVYIYIYIHIYTYIYI
jgi:hypothetical protein